MSEPNSKPSEVPREKSSEIYTTTPVPRTNRPLGRVNRRRNPGAPPRRASASPSAAPYRGPRRKRSKTRGTSLPGALKNLINGIATGLGRLRAFRSSANRRRRLIGGPPDPPTGSRSSGGTRGGNEPVRRDEKNEGLGDTGLDS